MNPELLLDAEFLAADAAQLAAQGIGENQIAQVLVSSGADSALANQAAKLAISGADIATITSNELNKK
jgi:fructose-1-phosphate kinase PfkB-like protein